MVIINDIGIGAAPETNSAANSNGFVNKNINNNKNRLNLLKFMIF